MKNWWTLALGVVFSVLSAGVIYLSSQPPRGNPIALLPPPTPIPIQVHISGEVQNPGVYTLQPGERVQDAIEAAGGLTNQADPTTLNLAFPLEDGTQVQVHAQTQVERPSPTTGSTTKDEESPAKPKPPSSEIPSSQPININTAT